jgi:hypothetical protein
MKQKLKETLFESSNDLLLEIIETLCNRDKNLENEIEFLLNPKKIKNPESHYNKFVKKAIDTNSWSKFPNKGVTGLWVCLEKIKILKNAQNFEEAKKLGISILAVIDRCKRNYNSQNVEELNQILERTKDEIKFD